MRPSRTHRGPSSFLRPSPRAAHSLGVRREKTRILSRRECQVISMLLDEHQSKEIAYRLGLSDRTVSTYKLTAMKKLGVTNDVALVKLVVLTDLGERLRACAALVTATDLETIPVSL